MQRDDARRELLEQLEAIDSLYGTADMCGNGPRARAIRRALVAYLHVAREETDSAADGIDSRTDETRIV